MLTRSVRVYRRGTLLLVGPFSLTGPFQTSYTMDRKRDAIWRRVCLGWQADLYSGDIRRFFTAVVYALAFAEAALWIFEQLLTIRGSQLENQNASV